MPGLDARAHLRAVVARARAQEVGVGRRRIGQLHELHEVIERLPVGEAAGRALQAELAEMPATCSTMRCTCGWASPTTASSTPSLSPFTGSPSRAT